MCHIGLDCEELVREACRERLEIVACFADVDGVDAGGAVDEAAFCDSEADAAVCAGDF